MDNPFTQTIFQPTASSVSSFFDGILHLLQGNISFTLPSVVYFVSYVLSLFGITMILYCLVRMFEINNEEYEHLHHAILDVQARYQEELGKRKNDRWEHVQDLVNSPSPSDWRLAIMEADSILEGILNARDIPGMNVGEKLRSITPGDLGSIQPVWEAHQVRNRIAHEGSNYDITQVSARRTIQQYEVAFQEFGYI